MRILGISAYYHDSAAALIDGQNIVAAVQEERFTRIKHDASFPINSIKFCLEAAHISLQEVDAIAFYDKPFLKFERILQTYVGEAPFGIASFLKAMPIWLKEKLFLKDTLASELLNVSLERNSKTTRSTKRKVKTAILNKLLFAEHHQSHAASAFFPSPFKDAAVVTIDGVGEWATTSIAFGSSNKLEFLREINFPHSIGLLYSAFTYHAGFKVNSGEYKLMGLAPYGQPKYVDMIKEHLIDIKEDGSFRLNMKYFNYTTGLTMTNSYFDDLFNCKPRLSESALEQTQMDLAASVQTVIEEVMVKLAKHAQELTGSKNLCLAGGVALNCVGNGKILRSKFFEKIWIQPASGDAGGALGAALAAYHQEYGFPRAVTDGLMDNMKGSYLGPEFSDKEIKVYLDSVGAAYQKIENEEELLDFVVDDLIAGKVVGWHQGASEFGPRALGNRSIIGDPRNKDMQFVMNLKIKFRESFRPFAPSVISENVSQWFELNCESPYMLLVAPVSQQKRVFHQKKAREASMMQNLRMVRSEIPAVTHVDHSARVQTVHPETNPKFYRLIKKFNDKTGCPMVVNTSFNVRGEPIVNSPTDSYKCFMRTKLDTLVIGGYFLKKSEQPEYKDEDWQQEYELD